MRGGRGDGGGDENDDEKMRGLEDVKGKQTGSPWRLNPNDGDNEERGLSECLFLLGTSFDGE